MACYDCMLLFFFFKQKTAYELRISDWSSYVCSFDLLGDRPTRCLFGQAKDFAGRTLGEECVTQRRRLGSGDQFGKQFALKRSEERRVGNESGSTCRSRWWP